MTDKLPPPPRPPKKPMSRKKKVVLWVVGVFVVLGVIGAIAGGDDDKKTDTTASNDAPPAKTTPVKETPAKVDTGRMSTGEFNTYMDWWQEVLEEQRQMGEGLQKCGVLIEAVELSEASTCIDDAFDGMDVKLGILADNLKDVQGDVAKKCLISVRGMRSAVVDFDAAAAQARRDGKNLQFDEFVTGAQDTLSQQKRMQARHTDMLTNCMPEDWSPNG